MESVRITFKLRSLQVNQSRWFQESVSASQSKSLVPSIDFSEPIWVTSSSISLRSQSESLIQASISNSYQSRWSKLRFPRQSDSLVQASASTSESASTSHVVAASQVSESGSFSRSVSESLSTSQWTSHSGSLASASLSKSDSYSQSASLLSTSESASTSMPVSEFPFDECFRFYKRIIDRESILIAGNFWMD